METLGASSGLVDAASLYVVKFHCQPAADNPFRDPGKSRHKCDSLKACVVCAMILTRIEEDCSYNALENWLIYSGGCISNAVRYLIRV